MSLNKGQKLVKMVELMTRRGGVRAIELMDRFGLDARTMRRYLADLRELNIPIVDDGRGDDRVVSVDPQWRRTGVQLTLVEVLSLHFGRTLFNFLDGTSFATDLSGAIERLEPAISRAHQDLCRQLDTKFLAVPEGTKDFTGPASDMIDEAITALVYNNLLETRYRKANGTESSYTLEPYSLAVFRQGLYLFAFDRNAGLVKTFALERFTEISRRRGEHFQSPVGWRPSAHIANAFGIITGPAEDVLVEFHPRAAPYIRERIWHPTQTIRSKPNGWIELRMHVANTVELHNWILSFGANAIVEAPESLRSLIARRLRDAAAHYE